MAGAKATVRPHQAAMLEESKEMVIIGGGICGVIAAKMCYDRNISYRLIEREAVLGGNWHTLANAHSYLQAFEPNYRWDNNYRLDKDPLTKNSAQQVLHTLQRYAEDHQVPSNTLFQHEAVHVTKSQAGNYRCLVKDLRTGAHETILAQFLCITPGILSTQFTAAERGVKGLAQFQGVVTLGGRHAGVDSAVGSMDLHGKRVVILGSGSFAAEALEAADRAGAEHITIISRPRYRWILPFSRQYTISAIANAPLLPWSWKVNAALWYLRKRFYEPCGLKHMAPSGGPEKMDYSGQCNDGYFRLAYEGRLTCIIDTLQRMDRHHAILASGEKLECDVLVVAAGCKYNLNPAFLTGLELGFCDLHNHAFLGANPRIGCASDFVFAYVPWGPMKQLEMFFHSVDCCKKGLEKEVRNAMRPTPLPNHGEGAMKGGRQAGHHTFFEYRNWWDTLSIAQHARVESMLSTLDVGRGTSGRIALRVGAAVGNFLGWVGTCWLAILELWRYPVYGPGAKDHHHKFVRSTDGDLPQVRKLNAKKQG